MTAVFWFDGMLGQMIGQLPSIGHCCIALRHT